MRELHLNILLTNVIIELSVCVCVCYFLNGEHIYTCKFYDELNKFVRQRGQYGMNNNKLISGLLMPNIEQLWEKRFSYKKKLN